MRGAFATLKEKRSRIDACIFPNPTCSSPFPYGAQQKRRPVRVSAVSASQNLGRASSFHSSREPTCSSPFPYGAHIQQKRIGDYLSFFAGDPYGTRTHVTTVKGWCLNRLTNGPYSIFLSQTPPYGWFSDKARWTLSSVTLNATYRISLNSSLKSIINAFLNGQLGLTA